MALVHICTWSECGCWRGQAPVQSQAQPADGGGLHDGDLRPLARPLLPWDEGEPSVSPAGYRGHPTTQICSGER